MENSQTSPTTPTTSASASGEPVIVSISTNTTAQGNLLSPNGNLISLNASFQIPFKLAKNGGNYASWKSQMTNLLFGYGFLGFVDGTRPCPLQTDPRYILWTRQDRLVLLGIQATVNSTISPTINNCTTSADAWNKLETSFTNRSNTRMLSIMSSLMSNKKEGKTVAAYMSKDLYDKLLDEELIRNHGEPNEEEVQVTAQFTQKRFNHKGRGGRGRHRGGYNNTTHGTDNNLGGQNSQPNHMQFNRQQQPFYGRGHSVKTCRSRGQPSSHFPRPQANLDEGKSSYPNKNWVLDSGATHHITFDLQNLSMHSDYVGNEDFVAGNGFE
ncbi:hypothetical protein ACOSQ4_000841 [Xanthoceras sorbifolium]